MISYLSLSITSKIMYWLMLIILVLPQVYTEFFAGRIKPGTYEYPKLNGWMLVKEAEEKCEHDFACAGFTFKGSYKTLNRKMEMYFFHIVPEENNYKKYFYWSTFKVERHFVKLVNITLKREYKNSQEIHIGEYDAKDMFDHEKWGKNNVIAGIQPKPMLAYSKIDFADFIPTNKSDDTIIINLENSHNIYHTFPKIDRCCKMNGKRIKYDGIDNMERIKCDMPQNEFTEKYVNKREAIMMTGCQEKWKAKNWTIENLLNRYNNISINQTEVKYFMWQSSYQKNHKTKTYNANLRSNEMKKMLDNSYLVKVFNRLPKGEIGWSRYNGTEYKQNMIELMEEYAFPKPMPEDIFQKYHVDSDQSYLMLATAGTGTKMHIDPEYTDAFNALISGEKWWVSLPKDLYEFNDQFTCNKRCSDHLDNFQSKIGLWFIHMLPQIRSRTFYGKKLKTYLQKPGETLYMPNLVLHSVWNTLPSIAIGDNPLYESSFDEWIGSGGVNGSSTSDWIYSRILLKAKGYTKTWITDISQQVNDAIRKYNITNYTKPVVHLAYD